MVTKHDSTTTMLPKRKLTTYGKTARKKQSKTPYQSATADDDSTPKQTTKAITTQRRFAATVSPTSRSPSPEPDSRNRTVKRKAEETRVKKDLNLDRKRKFSQVSSKAQTEKPIRSQQDSSPSVPVASDDTPSSRPSSTQRPRMKSASSEDADIDMVEARLSSPPPTPTRSRMPAAVARATPKAGMPFSPNTMQIWDNLLDSDDENTSNAKPQHRQIPVRLAPRSNPKASSQETSSRVAGPSRQRGPKAWKAEPAPTPQSKRPRRRLIDALVEQAADTVDGVDAELSDNSVELSQPLSSQLESVSVTPSARPTATKTKGSLYARPAFTPKPQSLARTYGQGTKVLQEDEDDMLFQAFDIPESSAHSLKGKPRLQLRGPKQWSNPGGLEDEEDALASSSPNTKIRDIHELRQAGANTRVADEMQDLTEQVGIPTSKPTSSRRAALLRIAEEIKNKEFMRQFRDHGIDAAIFQDIGKETDVISAYLIMSTLITLLSKWPSPHTIRLLQEQEIGSVFARLLKSGEDMKKVVQDRKNNLSKRTQIAVLDVQKYLRELPIWGTKQRTTVSPRSLSIKCLHLLVSQEPGLGRDIMVFPERLTAGLLAVLSEATDEPGYLDYPENDGSIDLCNTLAILDVYGANVASSGGDSSRWCDQFLPIVADVFGSFLRSPPQKDKTLETSILKIAINLTNNNLNAPDICISKGLVPALAGSICNNFGQVLASISQDQWLEGLLDDVVLRLGILINFTEHSVRVRQVAFECEHEGFRPIDEFIRLFLENYRRTAEVGLWYSKT